MWLEQMRVACKLAVCAVAHSSKTHMQAIMHALQRPGQRFHIIMKRQLLRN